MTRNREHVVTCRAQRENEPGKLCGAFVSSEPYEPTSVRIIRHSSRKRLGTRVSPCSSCGALHEISEAVDAQAGLDVA